ncbi:MAG TPA: FHA domain-containing serine/threonine-protein kinase [Gemmataceae bacterium]|nr:FHA domain-containing serine/threonine-protein kinase [Gemmataceae bacterium]
MPPQRLVIDADDRKRFCLQVRDGALTIGADPAHADLVLNALRVVRIHCEVEIDEGALTVASDPTTPGGPVRGREIHLGEEHHIGSAHVRLVMAPRGLGALGPAPSSRPDIPAAAEGDAARAAANLVKRLLVTDGADLGRAYSLAHNGVVTIGNSHRHASVVLHDLYVARVHCELLVDGDRVVVSHRQGRSPTRVNGREVSTQELHLGDVLRIGNSHLRYEMGVAPPPSSDPSDSAVIGVAPATPAGAADEADAGADTVAEGSPAAAPDPLLQLEGQVLGNYHFGPVLGRGLTSLVFQAKHRQTNQPTVVKVLSRDFPQNDAELQTFIRALRIVAPLRHPHLVTLLAAGKTGAHCWIAREYVVGESLAAQIARLHTEGKLGWKRACRAAVHLGQVLDYLANHQIKPARITPANVLVDNETRAAKLADVLLDQALQGSKLEDVVREKRQLAELPYCAPEQTEPETPADERAGLYSLGALLYALLTGQPPYNGVSPSEIIARVQEGKLVKPSKILRETPAPFESVVLRLLARWPDDRFQSAADLLAVVEPIANMHEIKV